MSSIVSDPTRRQKMAWKIAVAAILFWTLALAAMWLFTANPTIVSRDQLLHADAVVTARLDRPGQNQIRVEEVLAGDLNQGDVVALINLPEKSELSAGRLAIVPVTRVRREFEVTVLDGQRAFAFPPLIYRATPETIGEVRRILRAAN